MTKRLRLIPAATLAVAVAFVLIALVRQHSPPTAQSTAPSIVHAPGVPENALPQTGDLLAKLERVPGGGAASPQPARLGTQPGGAIRFLGVEPGWRLPAGDSLVRGNPAETARRFLLANRGAFGLANPRADLTVFRTLANPGRASVRLQQTYGELPVLVAETVVQVSDAGDIQCVLADLATDVANLDHWPLPLTPEIPGPDATNRAADLVSAQLGRPLKAEAAQLIVYVPAVLGLPGEAVLAWEVPVASPVPPVHDRGRAILHASSGALLNYLVETHASTNRRMYDDNNSAGTEPTLGGAGDNPVRVEGGLPTGIAEVDNLYDLIAQTDAFYLANHGRDGYNGAAGRIFAIARYSPPGGPAPWPQASAGGNVMQFGVGYVTDDIVAHEYTHLVTEQTSRLIYQNASGAINEAFSDLWGEFMDLSNTGQPASGNDSAAVRWEVGEDRPAGPLRSMRDPGDLLLPPASRRFSHPDRLGSANYVPVATNPPSAPDGDNGGVHSNSGVCNKLVYLLTDGDAFNGQTITGEGIANVARLFYDVQTAMLVPAADWRDLYFAITQSAANLEWSAPRQINVNRACSAVEIAGTGHDYYIDRLSPSFTSELPLPRPIQQVGIPNVVGDLGPFRSIPAGIGAVNPGGTLNVNGNAGTYNVAPGSTFTISKPLTMKTYNAPTTIAP